MRFFKFFTALCALFGSIGSAQAQTDGFFAKKWKSVDSLEQKGLPESAMKIVAEIKAKALADKNPDQIIKATVYRMKFFQSKEEDAYAKLLEEFETETQSAPYPVKPIYHSMLADIYWAFYLKNQYYWRSRTETENFDKKDLRTWTLKDVIQRCYFHLNESLLDENRLQSTNLQEFHEVLGYTKDSKIRPERNLRPTLYDFVAHKSINLLKAHYAYSFETEKVPFSLNQGAFLDTPEIFAKASIEANDSLSANRFILSLYQKLTQFHLKDTDPSALLNLSFLRLEFVNQKGVMRNKDEIYFQTLEKIVAQYPENNESALYFHAIANYYNEKGTLWESSKNPDVRQLRNKALEVCEATAKKFPESVGAEYCLVLKSKILEKSLQAEFEEAIAPDAPFLLNVSYRNVAKGFFKIVKISESELNEFNQNYYEKREKLLEKFAQKPAVEKKEIQFPEAEKDRQTHRFLLNFNALPLGNYMIFVYEEDIFDQFKASSHTIFYAPLFVTALSPHLINNHNEGGWQLRVLHRKTGKSLAGVKVSVTKRWYDYKSGREKKELFHTLLTDSNGEGKIPYAKPKQDEYPNYSFSYELGTDKLSNYDHSYNSEKFVPAGLNYQINAFTDRAIYRPGQTVFFKAIVFGTDGKNAEIVANKKITAEFYDVNYQKIAEQNLTTNEYGAVSGSFTAPKSGILGNMNLVFKGDFNAEQRSTTKSVRVEEYKRPKFEVKFEPLTTSFRLNDKAEVVGKAIAYSGAAIDGAKVVFRVKRQAKYAGWYARYYGFGQNSPAAEIENGTLTTDEKGNFKIAFDALPDPNAQKDAGYNFEITADVTDINGETHTSSTTIFLAKEAIFISSDLQEEARLKDKNLTFKLSVKTANGTDDKAKGTFSITRLKSPENPVFVSKFTKADVFVLSKEDFKKIFPNESYAGEEDIFAWEKGEKLAQGKFDSEISKVIRAENLPAGVYFLEIESADRFGTPVFYRHYFTLFEEKSEKLPYPVLASFVADKSSYEPSEKINFEISSGLKDVNAYFELYRGLVKISSKNFILSEKTENISFDVSEEDRGGLVAKMFFVRDNRVFEQSLSLAVPFSNKDLEVSFETFRDKLQPGEKEQWKIKISGAKKEKVAAEMLASLYDASLDAFAKNNFSFSPYTYNSFPPSWTQMHFGNINLQMTNRAWNLAYYARKHYYYEVFNWFGFNVSQIFYVYRERGYYDLEKTSAPATGYSQPAKKNGNRNKRKEKQANGDDWGGGEEADLAMSEDESPAVEEMSIANGNLSVSTKTRKESPGATSSDAAPEEKPEPVQIRTNFNETAFFMPDLKTDENGDIYVNFTIPESLTKWKLLGLAHTKDVKFKIFNKELQTQKTLMVVPNAPRFFRENDQIVFAAKITNLSDKTLSGAATLELLDAFSLKKIISLQENQSFTAAAGQSTVVKWTFDIPEKVQAITYRIVARADKFSDGEEMTIPVLTNRMMVTETMPLPTRGGKKEQFIFQKLKENNSSTLRHHQLTLEFTSAPAWYAIQALPYLMEYPYECAEQVFSRYYANALAAHIVNASPKIKAVFETWKNTNSIELYSKLEQNQELKTAILEETPWVLAAAGETQRKKNVALLFDLAKMSGELKAALTKLEKKQHGNGGFSWFEGMKPSWYITQHILGGLAHLQYLGVMSQSEKKEIAEKMMKNALSYCDGEIADLYEDLQKQEKRGYIKLSDDHLSAIAVQYLYVRSFFVGAKMSGRTEKAFQYFMGQAEKYWLARAISNQAMLALVMYRHKKEAVATDITKSLRERSLVSAEMGRYWKEMTERSYWWYDAPIETMALLMEAFAEIHKDLEFTDEMKTWLLKNKQTNAWTTTKATTEAVYALFLNPEKIKEAQKLSFESLEPDANLEITVGKHSIKPNQGDVQAEAGTGYFKTTWKAEEITSEMGEITVNKPSKGAAWGGIYWQYFEQLDKITTAETPLKLTKKLFRVENSASGQVMKPIENGGSLKTGDLVRVRIELRVDREMEYIHLKDMRASGFEPVNVLSTYKWQDGLGYYESTRDAATNFFIGDMPKGTYVFEYDLRANNAGNFSNGITTIQCMYAPEFSSHSEGIRVSIGE